MRIETVAVHAAFSVDPSTGAVAPPIHLSTTFGRDEAGRPLAGHTYVRESNPTQDLLEEALSRLEGGEAALAFGSGMAAGLAVAQALPPGSHVVLPEDVYYAYRVAARDFFPAWGLTATFAPLDRPGALSASPASRDAARLAREPVESAPEDHRPGGVRRGRQGGRRARPRRQHVRDADPPAAARPGRRRRPARHDEGDGRAQRRSGRSARLLEEGRASSRRCGTSGRSSGPSPLHSTPGSFSEGFGRSP